ncbi:thioredoxin-interacting protein [Sarotherodon galilaeus]
MYTGIFEKAAFAMHLGLSSTPKQHIESLEDKMSGRGDGSHNNRNDQQVNPENLPSGDQEPAYEPRGGLLGLLNNLYRPLYNIFWRMNELLDELYASDDDLGIDFDNVNDGNVNNVNIHELHDVTVRMFTSTSQKRTLSQVYPGGGLERWMKKMWNQAKESDGARSFLMMTLTSSLPVTLIARAVLMLVILLMRTSKNRSLVGPRKDPERKM